MSSSVSVTVVEDVGVGVRFRVWSESILQFRVRGCSVELGDVSRGQWKVCRPGHMSAAGGCFCRGLETRGRLGLGGVSGLGGVTGIGVSRD